MNTTWFEKGIEKGIETERREFLQVLLEEQFGPLSENVTRKLKSLSVDQLESLRKKVLTAKSLGDLGLGQ